MKRADAVSLRQPSGRWRYGLWVLVLLWAVSATGAAEPALRLTLPPEVAAVVGVEMNVYFSNVSGQMSTIVQCRPKPYAVASLGRGTESAAVHPVRHRPPVWLQIGYTGSRQAIEC